MRDEEGNRFSNEIELKDGSLSFRYLTEEEADQAETEDKLLTAEQTEEEDILVPSEDDFLRIQEDYGEE